MAFEQPWSEKQQPEAHDHAADSHASLVAETQDHQREVQRVAMVGQVEQQLDAGLTAALDQLLEKTQAPKAGQDVWGTIYGVFDKFPNGASISKGEFPALFGDPSAKLLDQIGVQSINIMNTRDGQHYKLTFAHEDTRTIKSADITTGQNVEFDVSKKADSITLDHVKGLKVKKTGGVFSATIDQVAISHPPNGNVVIVGKGHWGIFHGSKTVTVAPDGTITTDK
jgi:hypothetical protein